MLPKLNPGLLSSAAIALSGLFACTPNPVPSPTPSATPAPSSPEQPNLSFAVDRQSGTCPTSIGAWEMLLPLEGGADHIVVADIRPAQVTASTERSVIYAAPLPTNFATCVGQATSPQVAAYRFEFRDGQVFFQIEPSAQVSATVVSRELVSGRPWVYWRAEEGP